MDTSKKIVPLFELEWAEQSTPIPCLTLLEMGFSFFMIIFQYISQETMDKKWEQSLLISDKTSDGFPPSFMFRDEELDAISFIMFIRAVMIPDRKWASKENISGIWQW